MLRHHEQGSTLLLTILVTGLIGFLLAAYLTLVQSQNRANVRSQSWNSAMPVAEAGIEEALEHLNKNGATNATLKTDGWNGSGATFSVNRLVRDAFYSVTIKDYYPGSATNTPVIESKGYIVMPLVLACAQGALLASSSSQGNINYFGRGVRVRTRQDFIFSRGIVAKDSIDMHGNNVRTDSFDSTDPNYSTNGMYYAAWARANGDVAVNASVTNSLSVGDADIYGHVSTGPHGSISMGLQGSVGSAAWHAAGNQGVEAGWAKNNMNVGFPEVQPPFTGGAYTPSGGWITNTTATVSTTTNSSSSDAYPSGCSGTVSTNITTSPTYPVGHPGPVTTNYDGGGQVTGYTYPGYTCHVVTSTTNTTSIATYYDYILDDGNYQLTDLNGTVYVRGQATLYVTDSLNVTALVINPERSLRLYCAAASASLSGNNTADSDGTADSFSFWGLSSCRDVQLAGNASFTGTIYAPSAGLKLAGGNTNNAISSEFIGASITKTATLDGHLNFHYDEALRKIGPFRGYIVSSWNEMSPAEVPILSVAAP